jgi:hypothetical protein
MLFEMICLRPGFQQKEVKDLIATLKSEDFRLNQIRQVFTIPNLTRTSLQQDFRINQIR